jgi:hypothetical protein
MCEYDHILFQHGVSNEEINFNKYHQDVCGQFSSFSNLEVVANNKVICKTAKTSNKTKECRSEPSQLC